MKWKSFFEERKKRLQRKAWWAFWRKRPSIYLYFSYSLSWNKESKFKAVSNHAKNIRLSSWRFELAALKHQIVFAHASVFDAPLFFTHHLIRPCKNDIQILKILNQVQNDVDLKSEFLFHCKSCRTRFGIFFVKYSLRFWSKFIMTLMVNFILKANFLFQL